VLARDDACVLARDDACVFARDRACLDLHACSPVTGQQRYSYRVHALMYAPIFGGLGTRHEASTSSISVYGHNGMPEAERRVSRSRSRSRDIYLVCGCWDAHTQCFDELECGEGLFNSE
jgi:hypothetical protein